LILSLVLATGGLGFIGSHTCLNLIQNGFDVLIIDSLVNSSEENFNKITKIVKKNKTKLGKVFFRKGDIRDQELMENIFVEQVIKKKPIEAVIHFAGLKSVEESIYNPIKYWDVNINSTLNLLKVMDKYDCNCLVFSSSATIYAPYYEKKLFENSPQKPINPYGNSKLAIETILNDFFFSKEKWRIINLRYFNPVGAHNSGLLGENPTKNANNLFPVINNVVTKKLDLLSIYGNDWPTIDGTCVRDFIHVMDLANAHIAALKFLQKNKPQIISINIGTGVGKSVLEVVNTYSKVNNVEIPYHFVSRRKGDASFIVADNSLALKLLDWTPKKSLEEMCFDSFNFIKNQ
tara:strand:- start:146 stop:1186 length:1041 start_codon:yes stop_codon:yes gene_type:complete